MWRVLQLNLCGRNAQLCCVQYFTSQNVQSRKLKQNTDRTWARLVEFLFCFETVQYSKTKHKLAWQFGGTPLLNGCVSECDISQPATAVLRNTHWQLQSQLCLSIVSRLISWDRYKLKTYPTQSFDHHRAWNVSELDICQPVTDFNNVANTMFLNNL